MISVSAADGEGIVTLGQTKASLRRKEDELTLQIQDVLPVWPARVFRRGRARPTGSPPGGASSKRAKPEAPGPHSRVLSKGPAETKHKINKALGLKTGTVGPEVDALMVRREVAFIKGTGFVLDNPVARRERVTRTVSSSDAWRSVAEIAKAAHVDGDIVNDLLREGVLCRSAEGRFLVKLMT